MKLGFGPCIMMTRVFSFARQHLGIYTKKSYKKKKKKIMDVIFRSRLNLLVDEARHHVAPDCHFLYGSY